MLMARTLFKIQKRVTYHATVSTPLKKRLDAYVIENYPDTLGMQFLDSIVAQCCSRVSTVFLRNIDVITCSKRIDCENKMNSPIPASTTCLKYCM